MPRLRYNSAVSKRLIAPCFALLALRVTLGLATAAGVACPVQLGAPVETVLATWGAPTRTIEAGEGRILFYGATLLFVTNGCVGFVSVAEPSGVEVSASLIAAESVPLAPPSSVLVGSAVPRQESRPPLDSQQQRLVTRARQFAVTKAYASICRHFLHAMPLAHASDIVGMKDARGHPLPAFGDHASAAWYAMGVEINQLVLSD